MGDEENSLEETLTRLRKEGKLNEIRDFDEGEIRYQLTDEGESHAKELIHENGDAQLFLFQLMWNDFDSGGEGVSKLFRIASELQENPGINILRTLLDNQDKVDGIQFSDDIPEKVLRRFDP